MANHRMFAKTIVESDAFLSLPITAQALYFHLGMNADDDGFVNSPRRIQAFSGAREEDLTILAEKRFILAFDTGVIVIKHWRIHNYIPKDRYKSTLYKKERQMLAISGKNAYTEADKNACVQSVDGLYTSCIQVESNVYPQDKISKDKLSKENKNSYSVSDANPNSERGSVSAAESSAVSPELISFADKIREAWNAAGLPSVRKFMIKSERGDAIKVLVDGYGIDTVLECVERAGKSEFLKRPGTRIGFDWFLKPDNFQKVLEGNYDERWVSDDNLGGTDGTGGAEAGRGGKGAGSGGYDGLSISERIERKREAAKRKWGGLGDTLD